MLKHHCIYYIRIRPPLRSILFPYTTLFRSWLETNNLFNNLIQRNQSAAFSSGKVRPNHETNINIIARIGFAEDRKSGSAGMPRPISYAVFCLKKKSVLVKSLNLSHLRCVYPQEI